MTADLLEIDSDRSPRACWVPNMMFIKMQKQILFVALSLLVLCVPGFADDQKPPSNTANLAVSPETTRATKPVRENGTVDYTAALNNALKGDVTPENNAAVLIVKAIGPNPDGMEYDFHVRLCDAMGVEPLPADAPGLVTFGKAGYGFEPPAEGGEFEDLNEIQDRAMDRPWQKEELPNAARWVELNETALDLVSEAVLKPGYFRPIISDEEHEDLLVYALLPDVQASREIGRCLVGRAMLHLGEKNYQAAADDLLTLHRFARKIAQGATLVENLVGYALEGIAFQADNRLIQQPDLPLDVCQKYRQQLSEIESFPNLAKSLDLGERYLALQILQQIAITRMDAETLESLTSEASQGQLLEELSQHSNLDWNLVFREVNSAYDQVVQILNESSREDRIENLKTHYESLNLGKINPNLLRMLKSRRADRISKEQITEAFVRAFLGMLLPAIDSCSRAEARTRTYYELSLLGLQLREIQLKTGSYPATLPEQTFDLFSGKPYQYQFQDGEFTLYSVGENGRDDGGMGYNNDEDPETDDLTVTSRAEK